MHYSAKNISLVTVLIVVLSACGGDKPPESAPELIKGKNNSSIESKAEVIEQYTEVSKISDVDVGSVEALSIKEGKKRYEQTCKICHEQGLLGAPKTGDKVEWAQRLKKGVETLHRHSAQGYNKMPAQAVGTVTEAEVYAAVDYMLEQAK